MDIRSQGLTRDREPAPAGLPVWAIRSIMAPGDSLWTYSDGYGSLATGGP
jgi:hypothetical protein